MLVLKAEMQLREVFMADKVLTPAAACIRMSGRTQDKSPAEQAAEITRLAVREGCQVVDWFTDEAITGDSSTSSRPGLAALLHGAQAGAFKVVLAGTPTASAVKARWTPSASTTNCGRPESG